MPEIHPTDPLFILHLRSSAGFFGAERVLVTLLENLPAQDVDAKLVTLANYINGNTDLLNRAQRSGIDASQVECKGKFDWRTLTALKAIISKHMPHVLHTHDYKSHVYGLLLAKYFRLPIVATVHGWTNQTFVLKCYEWLERRLLTRFDRVICVSPDMLPRLQRNAADDRIEVIPNGVDTERFRPEQSGMGRAHWGLEQGHFVFGNVARFTSEKGHILLLKAFEKIKEDFPNARLLLVGDGPGQEMAKQFTDNADLIQHVIFTGKQAHIENILPDIDCYISPSLTEGAPMSILEAMACAKPIIATDVGSVGEMLADGAGVVIPPGNVSSIIRSMQDILVNTGQLEEMKMRALSRSRQLYGAQLQAQRYACGYAKVVTDPQACDGFQLD